MAIAVAWCSRLWRALEGNPCPSRNGHGRHNEASCTSSNLHRPASYHAERRTEDDVAGIVPVLLHAGPRDIGRKTIGGNRDSPPEVMLQHRCRRKRRRRVTRGEGESTLVWSGALHGDLDTLRQCRVDDLGAQQVCTEDLNLLVTGPSAECVGSECAANLCPTASRSGTELEQVFQRVRPDCEGSQVVFGRMHCQSQCATNSQGDEVSPGRQTCEVMSEGSEQRASRRLILRRRCR